MSRTIRRKNCHIAKSWLSYVSLHTEKGIQFKDITPKCPEYPRAWWRFHGDRMKHFSETHRWKAEANKQYRTTTRRELLKWVKDPDHEVQIPRLTNLDYYW